MDMNTKKEEKELANETKPVVRYEPPAMISFSERDLAEELGPIQACSPFGNIVGC
ncbi:MAG: hypothetical protein AB1611_02010 [bacterium]